MNVTAVDCSRAGADADPDLVIALRGAPVLPRDGAWSVARQSGSNAPESLGVNDAVPLVRHPTAAPVQWHWADPEDIRSLNAPIRQYGLLQSTGTQKLFFGRPSVVQGQSKVQIPNPPRLADIGTLLNATGAFPHLTDALPFSPGAAESLDVSEQGLAIHKHNIDLSPAGTRTLLGFDSVPLEVLIDYRNARADVDIDPLQTPRWSVTVTGLNFPLITPFSLDVNDPIISIKGGFHADSESAATLDNLTVVYGSMLKPVQDLFSSLKDLCTFLPGGGGAALDVSFSNGMLTIRDEFALPTLPLGFGHIEGVAIMLGMTLQLSPASLEFTAGIGSEKKPFTWLVSPLSGTGAIEVGAKDSDVTFLIQGGIGVGLSIDIGIASGSASITLAIQVDNKIKPFEIKGILTGNASVDVLGGLASASLTLSAALGLVPRFPPIPDEIVVTAAVSVGIHISICWVVSIDFDGTWSFEQTFESPVSL